MVRQGDPGNVMYFIGEGKLEVRLYFTDSAEDLGDNPVRMDEVFHGPTYKASESPLADAIKAKLQLKPPLLRTHEASRKSKGNNFLAIGQLEPGEYFGECRYGLGCVFVAGMPCSRLLCVTQVHCWFRWAFTIGCV